DREQALLARQLDHVAAGGSSLRFVVGTFGAGKSLLLQALAQDARARGFVVMRAGLGPSARLSSTDGDAMRLLTTLTQNTSTNARPRGGAFAAVLERFVRHVTAAAGDQRIDAVLLSHVGPIADLALGPAVVHVLSQYVAADRIGDEVLR